MNKTKGGKVKRKLTGPEKETMSSITTLKIFYYIIVASNLLMPIMKPFEFGLFFFWQWLMVFVYSYSLFQFIGYGKQKIPFGSLIFLRILEVLWHTVGWGASLNWWIFSTLLLFDLIFVVLLIMIKHRLEFIVEKG